MHICVRSARVVMGSGLSHAVLRGGVVTTQSDLRMRTRRDGTLTNHVGHSHSLASSGGANSSLKYALIRSTIWEACSMSTRSQTESRNMEWGVSEAALAKTPFVSAFRRDEADQRAARRVEQER